MSKETEPKYLRFTISDRIEHWTQMLGFTLLGLTGLIQKFSSSAIGIALIRALGGIEAVRVIHRVAAVMLMFSVIYHIGAVGYKVYVKRMRPTMLPTFGDVKAAWYLFLNNIGRRKQRPQQGRYTFDEKFEYWAFVWGTVVMGLTGFMLWNPIASSRILPGAFIPAAKAAHSAEALLAVLAIVIWHFYNVHIKHLNKSMFTGKLSEHEMLEEHALELADIKAGLDRLPPDPVLEAKRRKIIFPVYGVVAAVMLFGVYTFVTIEDTAITTVPPAEQVEVFVPFTPTPLPTARPTPTPAPDAGNSWEAGIAMLFESKCVACHGAAALGGLDITSYESTLQGGKLGAGIVPGDLEASFIYKVQSAGGHPGQLGEAELQLIEGWITAGAPEQ